MTLTHALEVIQGENCRQKVTMIEYEDGSGTKFNYRLQGYTENRFIDLTDYAEKSEAYESMDKWIFMLNDPNTSPMGRAVAATRVRDAFLKIIS